LLRAEETGHGSSWPSKLVGRDGAVHYDCFLYIYDQVEDVMRLLHVCLYMAISYDLSWLFQIHAACVGSVNELCSYFLAVT